MFSRILLALVASAPVIFAQSFTPTGTLRAVFLGSNPVQGRIDPATGTASGPAADLTRALAKNLSVPFVIKGVANTAAVIDAVRNGQAEIGFLAFEPSRAQDISFSIPYSVAPNNYLVPEGSPVTATAGIDVDGMRVGVEKGTTGAVFLGKALRHAQLLPIDSLPPQEILARLDRKEWDAWAANKQRLLDMTAISAKFRILPEAFLAVEQSIVVAKGNQSLLDVVNAFLERAIQSGDVRRSLDAAGLTGAEPAPLNKQK